ncbi:MAG: 6-phosphofructokinase [Candidatus Hodarchaeota archaeon]
MKKIVIVTAGGHISAFHAGMKGMADKIEKEGKIGEYELYGAIAGIGGLMKGDIKKLNPDHLEPDRGGSLFGSDRSHGDPETIEKIIKSEDIHAIIMMGGDNHLGEAYKLFYEKKIPIVGYPKTMDGDLSAYLSLGWHTAVSVAARMIREHHHSAMTNRRVFYVGLFGRNTDWVPCAAGLYGGADLVIPCEEIYEWDNVIEKIKSAVAKNEDRYDRKFAVVAYSEGAKIKGLETPPGKVDYDAHGLPKLKPEWVGLELVRKTSKAGLSSCFESHTYSMRDGPPTEVDKKLSYMAGEELVQMIFDEDYGKGISFVPKAGGFFDVNRVWLKELAVQKFMKPTGYFDYEKMLPTSKFQEDYEHLFGKPPNKDDLVYKNLL